MEFTTIKQIPTPSQPRQDTGEKPVYISPDTYKLIGLVLIPLLLALWKLYKVVFKSPHRVSGKAKEAFVQLPSQPFFGPVIQLIRNRHDLPKLFLNWRETYGPCTRLKYFGSDILLLHDTNLLKTLLTSPNIGHLEKSVLMYKPVVVGASFNGLLSMPAKDWLPHRKTLQPLFTYEAIKSYVHIYEKHAKSLVSDIMCLDEADNAKSSTYRTLIHLKCLDIITEILVGAPFDSVLGKLDALKFYNNLETMFQLITNKQYLKPWKCIPIIWYFDPERKQLEKCIHDFESTVLKIRHAHIKKDDAKFALDLMVNSNWTDDEILAQLMTLIVGLCNNIKHGHDTVSINFSLFVWLIALEQEHQLKCQMEVDEMFDRLEESGEELTLTALNGLKYLERCIKESLRLFPSTSLGTVREIKAELKLQEGLSLSPGTLVTYMPYILHRDPEVFPDPEKFHPDRFLPENVKNRSPYAYLPFSSGRRNCLGWKAGMVELTILSAVMFRHFHITTTDKREDIKIEFRFMLHAHPEPKVHFHRRR